MDAASQAVSNLLTGGAPKDDKSKQDTSSTSYDTSNTTSSGTAGTSAATTSGTTGHADTTVDQQVNPAVEHEKITRKHEDREQTVIDQERHKHHYHTTVQPLKDREVEAAQHEHRQEETQYRNIDKDTGDAKGEAEKQQAKFGNTSKEGKTEYSTTKEPTVHQGGSVHHHLHETIQPVIEKETIKPTVTHTTKPIHETITEKSENHGITRESAISVDEFKKRLGGEPTDFKEAHDGEPRV